MLVPSNHSLKILEMSRTLVPLAVLGASLAGSMHCVSMCGGLVSVAASTKRAIAGYHVGRLLGYLFLGALAGFLGEKILGTKLAGIPPLLAAFAVSLGLITMGIGVWQGRSMHLPGLTMATKIYFFLTRWKQTNPSSFVVGLMSILLPCGWLHGFVLGAVTTQSPIRGGVFLFFFWAGTLPAMSATPWLIHNVFKPLSFRVPRLSAMLLIGAGCFTLAYKMGPLISHVRAASGSSNTKHSCH